MKWKRRNIESYLILPEIIANLSGKPLQEIKEYLTNNFAISIPDNYKTHKVPEVLYQIDGKSILKEHENSIMKVFNISRRQIINKLNKDSICEDLITMVRTISQHLNN